MLQPLLSVQRALLEEEGGGMGDMLPAEAAARGTQPSADGLLHHAAVAASILILLVRRHGMASKHPHLHAAKPERTLAHRPTHLLRMHTSAHAHMHAHA
eukprot:228077-Chlamydomonas_euryale.AAC.2